MTNNTDLDKTREWIDADKLREVIEEARFLIRVGEPEIILNDLNALLATSTTLRNF